MFQSGLTGYGSVPVPAVAYWLASVSLSQVIALEEIEAAASRLKGVIRETPTGVSRTLSSLSGRAVVVKPEHLQRTGSFKIRGAYNFVSLLAATHRADAVVAASAGNHAQGVALAASLCGLSSTIYMPINASLPKIEATRAYGATVILEGDSVDACIGSARSFSAQSGAVFVPPFDDPAVIAGQATIGLELAEATEGAQIAVVPIGGGGLISGIAVALSLKKSGMRVIGVEAAGAASMSQALASGHPVVLDKLATMADGIAVRAVSALTLDYVERFVEEVVTVEEEEISRAVLVLLERCKWVVEPAGAVGLAAVLAGKIKGSGPLLTVLSGGNIDSLLLTRLVEHGLTAAGRFLIVRVLLGDKPGELAGLTAAIAELGLNVLSVDHHRSGAVVGLDEVEVILTLETRDPGHRDQVVPSLCARGYRAEALR